MKGVRSAVFGSLVSMIVVMLVFMAHVSYVRGATIDPEASETDLVREYCVGLPRAPSGTEHPTFATGYVVPGQLPAHLRRDGVQNIWKLQGKAWGPLTGDVHFGPLEWGGRTHHVIAYKDANHPIAELRDVMVFEGFAWGENVGWINMNTAQYFCNNATSYETFAMPGLGFREALGIMAEVNSDAVPVSPPESDKTYIAAGESYWRAFYSKINAKEEVSHYYFYGTRELYMAAMGVKDLWNTIQNSIGRKLYGRLGAYQVSLIINAPNIGTAEEKKKAFVDTGSFVFKDADDKDVIPKLSTLGEYEPTSGHEVKTYRVWVEGQAWSHKLGALTSPNPIVTSGHITESWEAGKPEVMLKGGEVERAVNMMDGVGGQLPLQIVPLVARYNINGPFYDLNKTGQLIGGLWSTRLGWMYFPEVVVENDILKKGVMFMKVEDGEVCPVPYVDRKNIHYTGMKQSFTVNVGVLANTTTGETAAGRKVHFWLPQVVGMTNKRPVNGWIVKKKSKVTDPDGITFENDDIPFQITCPDEFKCTITSSTENADRLTIVVSDSESYMKTGSLAELLITVNPNNPTFIAEKGFLFPFDTAPVDKAEWPSSCFDRSDEERERAIPTGTVCTTCDTSPLSIKPVTMCAVGNLRVSGQNTTCTATGTPRVDISLYTQSAQELGVDTKERLMYALELYDFSAVPSGGAGTTPSPVARIDNLLTDSIVQNPGANSERVFGFSKYMRIPLHELTWSNNYKLKSGRQYQLIVRTTVSSLAGAPAIPPMETELYFTTGECVDTPSSTLSVLEQPSSNSDPNFLSVPGGADFSKTAPIVPVVVEPVYIGFNERAPKASDTETKPSYHNNIWIKPHPVPLPKSYRDTFYDVDHSPRQVTTPVKLASNDANNAKYRTRLTKMDYYLYRAEVNAAGTIVKDSATLIPPSGGGSAIYTRFISDPKIGSPLAGTGTESEVPVIGMDFIAGDGGYDAATGEWSTDTKMGLFSPDPSEDNGMKFLIKDEDLEDGKRYTYFVVADPTYEVWERNLLYVNSPSSTGSTDKEVTLSGTNSVITRKLLGVSLRGNSLSPNGGAHYTVINEECGYGNTYKTVSGAKNNNLPTNLNGLPQPGGYSTDTSFSFLFSNNVIQWQSYWNDSMNRGPEIETFTCLQPDSGTYVETVQVNIWGTNSNVPRLSFSFPLPTNFSNIATGVEDSLQFIGDRSRVRNTEDYEQMHDSIMLGDKGTIGNPNTNQLNKNLRVRYQLVGTGNGAGGNKDGAFASDLLAGPPLFDGGSIPILNVNNGYNEYNNSVKSFIRYNVVEQNTSHYPTFNINWSFGRKLAGQLGVPGDCNTNVPSSSRYAPSDCNIISGITLGSYKVVARAYFDAVFENVVASKSLHGKKALFEGLGTNSDKFLQYLNGDTKTYPQIVQNYLVEQPLWDTENYRSTPRPIFGASAIVDMPAIAQGLKAQVSTVSFAPSSPGGTPIECYPGSTDDECIKRTMTYGEFEALVRGGTSLSGTTTSSIADSCTNKDGTGTEDAEECSTGGFMMAGAPLEITVFDVRDDQCNYVRGRDDVIIDDDGDVKPDEAKTEQESYHVSIDNTQASYMYYWGGTSNPKFTAQSCGTQFGRPAPDCMKVPVLLSLAPDYYATRTCGTGDLDPEDAGCVNIDYSSVYQTENTGTYQPIKIYVVGYDLLEDLKSSVTEAADRYAPIYTGRWSLEMNGIYTSHTGSMSMDNQRIFFTVKPSVPVFTGDEIVGGADVATGTIPTGPTIGFIKHTKEDYSKMALWKLEKGDNNWKKLESEKNIPAGAFLSNTSHLLKDFTDEIQHDLVADTSYQPIADGNSGYAVLLDLRDRFGNRLPAYNSSYAPTEREDGTQGFVNGIKDEVVVNAFLKKDDATLDSKPIATEQISLNKDNAGNRTNTGIISSDKNFGALQLLPVTPSGGGVGSLVNFAERGKFTLGSASERVMSYLNNVTDITKRIGARDESYLSPLHMLRLVSIAPTLANNQGSFDKVRWTTGTESPTVSLSKFKMVDGTSGRTVTVGSSGSEILKFNGGTECSGGSGGSGTDCFKPTVEAGKDSTGRTLSANITLPNITTFGANRNNTFQRDVQFYPALEVGCSLNPKDTNVGSANTACGLFHLDPLTSVASETKDIAGTLPRYQINKEQFQLTTGKTERFLVVLRSNLTDNNLKIEDIELHVQVSTGSNQIHMENIYVEEICNVRMDTSCDDDILNNRNSLSAVYAASGVANLLPWGTSNSFSYNNYALAYISENGLSKNILTLLSSINSPGTSWNVNNSNVNTVITQLAGISAPTSIYKLFRLSSEFGNQGSSAIEQLQKGDILLIRFAGTPYVEGGATSLGGSRAGTEVQAKLLYRVGNPNAFIGTLLPSDDEAYPMTAHYSETFRGASLRMDDENTITTCSIDVRGRVRTGTFTNIVGTMAEVALSGGMDTYLNMMKTVIDRNVAEFLRNVRTTTTVDPNESGGAFVVPASVGSKFNLQTDVISAFSNKPAVISNNRVIYLKNRNLVLGENPGSVLTFPTSTRSDTTNPMPITFVVDGGDLIIKSNIVYETCGTQSDCVEPQIGFIVRQQPTGNTVRGGNIFIDPEVTNVRGVFYAEGSMMTADDEWGANPQCVGVGTTPNSIEDCEIFDGFTEFNPILANQLYIKGVVISRNTIGGRDAGTPELPLPLINGSFRVSDLLRIWAPKEVSTKDLQSAIAEEDVTGSYASFANGSSTELFRRQWAQRYDFNYLRLCGLRQDSSLTQAEGLFPNISRFDGAKWDDATGNWVGALSGLISPSRNNQNPFPNVVFEYDAAIQSNTPPGFGVADTLRLE